MQIREVSALRFAADIRKAHPQAALLESTALDLDSPTLQPAAAATTR